MSLFTSGLHGTPEASVFFLQAGKDWLEDFLGLDGLGVLFESLERLGERGFSSIADALLQLECVLCIKAVMNSTTGLDYITNDSSYVRKLAKGE